MEECLAIKPDLIFLWDEAWFGFARFSRSTARRTAMGAAAALARRYAGSGLSGRVRGVQEAEVGELDRTDAKLLDMRCCPIPDKVRIRVYADQLGRTSRCRRSARAR